MSGGVPAGWVLVPADPTSEMQEHGQMSLSNSGVDDAQIGDALFCYRAMLAATPTPPSRDADVERVEKVARALCAAETGGPIGYFPDGSPMRAGGNWDEYADYQHEEWRHFARAALHALHALGER